MDSFTYGSVRRAPRRGRKAVSLVLGLTLVVAAGAAVFALTKASGDAVVGNVKDTTHQIDAAGDVQAQATLRTALSTATTASMDGGSFTSAGPEQLAALEPAFRYVDGSHPSTGANVVSVMATDQAWGGAVLSSSGTCFFIRVVGTAQAFGSGDPCTGEAAMGATGAGF
jgi:hypothetical protein